MNKRSVLLRLCVTAALAGLLLALAVTAAQAETVTIPRYFDKALKFIQQNQPMDGDMGSVTIKPTELAQLLQAMPEGATLRFTTKWAGVTFSNESEFIDLNKMTRNPGQKEIEAIIAVCPKLKRLDFSTKRSPSNDIMIPMTEKYPQIEFDWLLHLGGNHYVTTNATAFSTGNTNGEGTKLTSEKLDLLKYVPNLKAIDVGHNKLTNVDFLRYFPDLELLIIACSFDLTDMSPVASLTHLKYLEVFDTNVSDLTPLENCRELIDLNVTLTQVTDLTPLDNITTLERFWCNQNPQITEEQKAHFAQLHPNCAVDYTGAHATVDDWRVHDRYTHYRWCFKHSLWIPFDQPLPGA